MLILDSIVSTINISLMLLIFFFSRNERTKTGKIGFAFLTLLFMANTALIWL